MSKISFLNIFQFSETEDHIISIDEEGFYYKTSTEGKILEQRKCERYSTHCSGISDSNLIYSAFQIEREIYVVRRKFDDPDQVSLKSKVDVLPYKVC